MKTVETRLPAGEIIDIKKMSDGTWVIKQNVSYESKAAIKENGPNSDNVVERLLYRRVEAESLSMHDEFMKYKPKTESEEKIKELIKEAIASGVKNFYRPIIDPSFIKTGEGICYEKGRGPAVGKNYYWWKKVAEEFCPERNSRLGTILEYAAFLGVLIKNLVADGGTVSWAWNAVCNDSQDLGHYSNSINAQDDYEPTGSRCVCGYYDLANVYKLLTVDDESDRICLAGGSCDLASYDYPIAHLSLLSGRVGDFQHGVGWIVFSKRL